MAKMGAIEPSYNVPGSLPQWKEAVLDRAKSNYETFKIILLYCSGLWEMSQYL